MRGMGTAAHLRIAAVVVAMTAAPALAAEHDGAIDSGRFYLFFEPGHAQVIDQEYSRTVDLDTPDGFNLVLGGGFGYNITDHLGIELQAHGTEPDLRESSHGKIKELSNITLMPALRVRFPLGDGRLVPYFTAGVGYSISDINDTGDPKMKVAMDETSIAGSVAGGVEYFVTPNIAIGGTLHWWLYPDSDTRVESLDPANRTLFLDEDSVNLTSLGMLVHMRVFFGDSGVDFRDGTVQRSDRPRTKFLAAEGPFDTDDPRFYLYLSGGHSFVLDDGFGPDIQVKAPGDFNATLGGGLGMNFDAHWGAELQLLNTEPNLNRFLLRKVAELSTFSVIPMARFRWPFCGGRFVPYLTAGVGAMFANVGDHRDVREVEELGGVVGIPKVDVDDTTIAGTVGVGFEYFLNRHFAIGLSLPYYFFGDLDTTVSERDASGAILSTAHGSTNLSGPALLINLKMLMP